MVRFLHHMLGLLLIATLARGAGLMDGAPASSAVQAAYRAYLARDWDKVFVRVKEALEKNPQDHTQGANLLALAEQTFANAAGAAVHLGWELPPGIRSLTAGTERERLADGGRERRRIKLIVGLQEPRSITKLTLTRNPGQVLIDISASIGEWGDYHSGRFGDFLWCRRRLEVDEKPEGLYFLKITLKSGRTLDGWFLITQGESSASPLVKSPRPGEVLGPKPKLTFVNFRSPEYRPFENRELDVEIDQDDAGALPEETRSATAFEVLLENPQLEELVVGPHPAAESPRLEALSRGRYRLQLTYREQRQLGPITLTRDSSTSVPFSVRP
jgi:hypothetical protein